MLSVSELSAPRLKTTLGLRSASSTGGPGPVSVFATPRVRPACRRGQPLPLGFEHDLFGKPVPTFPDHALTPQLGRLSHSARFSAPIAPVSRQTSPRSVPRPADGELV